jgi:hypothetical protein
VAECLFSGTADKTRILVAAGAKFNANFADTTTGAVGQVNLGEFFLGDTAGNQVPVRDYLQFSANTGLADGGEVTRNVLGGLKLDVAEGECFISLTGETGILEHYWVDTTLDMVDDSHSWIIVNSSGVLEQTIVPPDWNTSVVLADVVTRSGEVVFLGKGLATNTYQGLQRTFNYRYISNGPRCISGVTTTADAVPLKLDFDGGSFYIGDNTESVTPTAAATFTAWYRSAGGAWVAVPAQTLIDDEQYNDPAGGLSAIPGGEYTGHTTFVAATEDGPEYHVVYGQMTNAVKASLTVPTPRTGCQEHPVDQDKSLC